MVDDLGAIFETGGAAAVELAASALAERGAKTDTCTNCGKPLLGPYCAICGQPRHTHRRSVRSLIHDFVVDFVNFDSRILRTARALLFQPGELPSAFREGRTQRYVPAIRLYLFVSLIFFILLSLTGVAILQLRVEATPVKLIYDAQGNYQDDDIFVLEIEDNGRGLAGLDPKAAASRNGLKNMRRRMEEIGGAFDLRAAPEAGTVSRFTVPLEHDHQ